MFCMTHDQLFQMDDVNVCTKQATRFDDVNGHIMSDATHFHKIYYIYKIYSKYFSRDSQMNDAPRVGASCEKTYADKCKTKSGDLKSKTPECKLALTTQKCEPTLKTQGCGEIWQEAE